MNDIKFLLRLNIETHTAIEKLAKRKFASMNSIINIALKEYCERNHENMISIDNTGQCDNNMAIHLTFEKDINRKIGKRMN